MAAEPDGRLLAGLSGRLPRPSLSPAYAFGLTVVSAAMIALPALYLSIIAASVGAVLWWAVHGLDLLLHGSVGSLKVRLFAYFAPLLAGGALPLFLVKPLLSRTAGSEGDLQLTSRDQPLLITFIERLAAVVGAPVPDRVVVDCQVNAGAGLELGLLRREGSQLVLSIGLPLAAGLTLPQFASVLAHEFGHFSQGAGMRLARIIRGVNAWFHRVVYDRDEWDESLRRNAQQGGWTGLAYLGAQLMISFARRLLFGLMVAGHGVSCFLSRQMEFDADQYGARVAGSSAFADASLRSRVLSVAARYVTASALGEGRLVDDLPGLIVRVADNAPSRLTAEIKMAVQGSGTGLFDSHPSDLERLRRVRAGRHSGLLSSQASASLLFQDFPAVCRQATLAFYEGVLGRHAPGPDALLPVDAFIAPTPPSNAKPKASKLEFPEERPPELAAHVTPTFGDAEAFSSARSQWRIAANAATGAVERFRGGHALMLDAGQAEALLAAGLSLRPRDFSLSAATAEGIERTRTRALKILAEANAGLEAAERALGERIGLGLGVLASDTSALPNAGALLNEAQRLLAALPCLERAQTQARNLRCQVAALDCLLANQRERIGHVGLDEEIHRRLADARRGLDSIRSSLEAAALPGPAWDIPPPWRDDPHAHVRSAARALDVLAAQHARAVARLVQIADGVENAITHPGA